MDRYKEKVKKDNKNIKSLVLIYNFRIKNHEILMENLNTMTFVEIKCLRLIKLTSKFYHK